MNNLKVIGWSPYLHSGGVTGHLLAMAAFISVYFNIDVGIKAGGIKRMSLEAYIEEMNRIEPVCEKNDFYAAPDNPCYLKYLFRYRERYDPWFFRKDGVYRIGEKLKLYRPVESQEEEAFARGNGDTVNIIDASGGNSEYSFKSMKEADVILVFLPCNITEINKFFMMYAVIAKKAFFIINRCEANQAGKVCELMNKYGIDENKYAIIGYSHELERACTLGNVYGMISGFVNGKARAGYFEQIKNISLRILEAG